MASLLNEFSKRPRSPSDTHNCFQTLKVTKIATCRTESSKTFEDTSYYPKRPSSSPIYIKQEGDIGANFQKDQDLNSGAQSWGPKTPSSTTQLLEEELPIVKEKQTPHPQELGIAARIDSWPIENSVDQHLETVDDTQTVHSETAQTSVLGKDYGSNSPPTGDGDPNKDVYQAEETDFLDEDMDWDAVIEMSNQTSTTSQPGNSISDLTTPQLSSLSHTNPKPFARPPFPPSIRPRSPITGLSSSSRLRTCFRIGELFNANRLRLSTPSHHTVILELFARVVHSSRESLSRVQHFRLLDLFADRSPPHVPTGTLAGWRVGGRIDRDSQVFLHTTREKPMYCRCLCSMERDRRSPIGWVLRMRSVRETGWDEIGFVKQATFRDLED